MASLSLHSRWRGARAASALLLVTVLVACATRSADVPPAKASAAEFVTWDCARIDDESDLVQQRAAETAWAVDEKAANNILALGAGVTLFWPALLAMRPDGPEAVELSRLKGRFEALREAAKAKACPAPQDELPSTRAAALPLALGERLVYEDRAAPRGPAAEWALRVAALRRNEIEYWSTGPAKSGVGGAGPWVQDRAGNLIGAPVGALLWPRLLRAELTLGAVVGGDMLVGGDPLQRARLRGQVVAVGAQSVAGRRFDAAVVELFGDAQRGEATTRVEGVIVIDRASGLLLRLDLSSAQTAFALQRRLVRIEAQP